jgi:MtN3 and saliva related transmembrane protein
VAGDFQRGVPRGTYRSESSPALALWKVLAPSMGDHSGMDGLLQSLGFLRGFSEAIGFWAAVLTTISFAPQLVLAWRNGGHGLSWTMLTLFGVGVGLWFLYGLLEMSRPVILANGLTGLQVLALLVLKIWRPRRRLPQGQL